MTADGIARWRFDDLMGGLEILRAEIRNQRFPRHFHADYTVGLVTHGANRFLYRRDRLIAPAGTLCLADPGEVHTGEADADGWTYWTLQLPAPALASLRAEIAGRPSAPPDFTAGMIDDPRAARLLAAFFRRVRDAGPLEREGLATAALGYLIRRHSADRPRSTEPAPDQTLARLVRDQLADRLAEPVTLAELAASTGAGRYRLLRAFSQVYGLPPHAWLVQARLARARALILAGTAIADAAAAVGFADQPHLTRLFKRSYGYTPGVLAQRQGSRPPQFPHRIVTPAAVS